MFTIIDFETTGLDAKEEQVIEVGAMKLDSKFREVGRINFLVQLEKGRKLKPFITELTGITEADLVNGVSSERAALGILRSFIGKDVIVAQFASFDLSYLWRDEEMDNPFICTRSMSHALDPKEKASLVNLVERYGVKTGEAHRAMSDVEMTAEVFQKMVLRLFVEGQIESIEDIYNVMVEHERGLPFVPKSANVVTMDEIEMNRGNK